MEQKSAIEIKKTCAFQWAHIFPLRRRPLSTLRRRPAAVLWNLIGSTSDHDVVFIGVGERRKLVRTTHMLLNATKSNSNAIIHLSGLSLTFVHCFCVCCTRWVQVSSRHCRSQKHYVMDTVASTIFCLQTLTFCMCEMLMNFGRLKFAWLNREQIADRPSATHKWTSLR